MVIRKIYKVGEVTSYLKNLFESDILLNDIWIHGEISNLKHHTSGHIYFTLKDDTSCLRCIMFRSRSNQLLFLPANGMNVRVRGYISIYERDGLYQLYVEELTPDGIGSLYLAYYRLKEQLHAEGLFDAEHKKPLPFLPRKIGVVTSPNGAAWRDIITILRRRFPGIPVVLAPAAVQGEHAPAQIVAALNALNQRTDIDVVIVGRGGGSLEELWAFNTEEVARAIFSSRIPVISAVGHETDFTIADLVADLRAPTPSAAAEIAVPLKDQLEEHLRMFQDRMFQAVSQILREKQALLQGSRGRDLVHLFSNYVIKHKQELRILHMRIFQRLQIIRESAKNRTQMIGGKLEALSPLAILKRGYSLCLSLRTGHLIKNVSQVNKGEQIKVILDDGIMNCKVLMTKEGTPWENRELGVK